MSTPRPPELRSPDRSYTADVESLGDSVVEPLVKYTEAVLDAHKPTAPIRLPPQNQLEVRLVNVAELRRLDELRGDVSLYGSLFWALVGSILGFLGNLASSGRPVEDSSWIYLGLVTAFTGIMGAIVARASRRAVYHRHQLFDEEPTSENRHAEANEPLK